MQNKKRGQISTEYLIVLSFALIAVLSTLGVAFFYSSGIRDATKFNQIESFAKKVTSSAETVYYSGYPARTIIPGYLPQGIVSIQIIDKDIIFTVSTSSGESIIAYGSNVNLTGSISTTGGIKKVYLNASADGESVTIIG